MIILPHHLGLQLLLCSFCLEDAQTHAIFSESYLQRLKQQEQR